MDFFTSVKTTFGRYKLFFSGRASRSEFWWFALFAAGTVFLGVEVPHLVLVWITHQSTGLWPLALFWAWSLFGMVWFWLLLLPGLGVTARRLHDTDRSGWWMVVPVLLAPVGLAMVNILLGPPGPGGSDAGLQGGALVAAIVAAVGLVMMVVLIVWLARRGTDGDNRFGHDPLAG